MKQTKQTRRIRRTRRTRVRIKTQGKLRLCIHRTLRHIYAQILEDHPQGSRVLATTSTKDKALKLTSKDAGGKTGAQAVGKAIAEIAGKKGIKVVAFDRSGFSYHGRVAALADAAREGGLEF